MAEIGLGVTLLSLVIWLGLLLGWGQFWRCDQRLESDQSLEKQDSGFRTKDKEDAPKQLPLIPYPSVCAVIPARNEAELLPVTLRSLLTQNYPVDLQVILVDDQSTDGTAQIARQTAEELGQTQQLTVISAQPLPAGWSGKLWAMEQGIQKAQTLSPDYILLTDADIEHASVNLDRLVAKAVAQDLDLVSVMVRLRCDSFWEMFLIPAFVFFFQKLYPFRWVNNPHNPTAAAAGGCILIRWETLKQIGGLETIRQALIDDCALAQAVKGAGKRGLGTDPLASIPHTSGKIWLGLSDRTRSLRPYPSLETIWSMVARTAFTQLNYNPLLLTGTLVGMLLVYLVPPLGLVAGALTGNWLMALLGLAGWLLMALAYLPTIRFYQCSTLFAFGLPAIAFLYNLMTLDSALRHWRGQGGAWKGRVYPHK